MATLEFGRPARGVRDGTPAIDRWARACGRAGRRLAAAVVALGALGALASAPAWADCTRPIRVPVAPVGMSVAVTGGEVGGVFPEVLRKVGAETGCQFDFIVVPRARVEAMFASGGGDLLLPATRTSPRDAHGDFVPMMKARAMLISLASDRAPVESLADLAERRELRVVVVRGFDYGEAYQQLLRTLKAQRRLVVEADPAAVVRSLERSLADVTVMAPSILAGTLVQDARTRPLLDRLRLESIAELGWGDSGIYLSRHLSAKDRELIGDALERNARSGAMWRAVQKHYPAGSYEEGLKPLPAAK
ncbi:transporter substrate-binding domain-containing protein [Mitsuaria sp. GD03876]|uniref:transporter substrate-binding domain-containing protein n=1 Tax=Mitsuaria sp. GD03876 TaxID=2975399 RepID=UPI00244A0BB7|nr:transporter substrate-binding domain-containing protein [Mitsuaria sp. GD03876]MDH0865987.1 transporter substrate-binding domain-containing protein [Mitsuaria sp. GD03876]